MGIGGLSLRNTYLLPHIESFEGYKASDLNAIINHPDYQKIVQDLQNNVWNNNFNKNPKSQRRG